jgi:hypothetical protein
LTTPNIDYLSVAYMSIMNELFAPSGAAKKKKQGKSPAVKSSLNPYPTLSS